MNLLRHVAFLLACACGCGPDRDFGPPAAGGSAGLGGTSGSGGADSGGGSGGGISGGMGGTGASSGAPGCDTVCMEHAFCDTASSPAMCACAPTYAGTTPDDCVFDGAIVAPKFTDPAAWESSGVAIDPVAFGPDAGSATFNESGWCGGSSLAQTVTMPDFALAEPLVVELQGQRIAPPSDCLLGGRFPGVDLSVDGQLQLLNLTSSAPDAVFKREHCLGEAAYGGDVTFSLAPNSYSNNCYGGTLCPPPILRELSIRPALEGECPGGPGIVPSASFTSSDGWTLLAEQANGLGGATAGVVDGQLELAGAYTCSDISATAALSVPLDATLPNAALKFDYSGGSGSRAAVFLEAHGLRYQLGELAGAGLATVSEATVCIPDFARGLVYDYALQLLNSSNGCDAPDPKTFRFDNMELISEPACRHDVVRDGGFELGSQLGVSPWRLVDGGDNCSNCEGTASVVADAGLAHAGSRSLVIAFAGVEQFGTPSASSFVRIPLPSTAGKPALKFWHRKEGTGTEALRVSSLTAEPTPGTATWVEHTLCIGSNLHGQVMPLTFESIRLGGASTTLYVDDVRIVLDPGC